MSELWTAADAFATAWLSSPHTRFFRDGLKPTPADPSDPSAITSVQHLLVRYSGMFASQPLLIAKRLAHVPEFGDMHKQSADTRGWFDIADRFAFACVETVEYLRSRLPGYPRLLVPDLMPGAPRVYMDGFWDQRFPWESEVRQAGLQLRGPPQLLAQALDLPHDGEVAYDALADLLDSLRSSNTWRQFVCARQALSPTDRACATARLREYREAVTEVRLDEVAGENGMRRQHMRRAEQERVKEEADGALRRYYAAFDEVDALIEAVAALVSHRVAVGDVDVLPVLAADWGPPSDLRALRIRANDSVFFRHSYEVVKTPVGLAPLSGLMVLHNINAFLDDRLLLADGWLLSGSHAIPSVGPAVP